MSTELHSPTRESTAQDIHRLMRHCDELQRLSAEVQRRADEVSGHLDAALGRRVPDLVDGRDEP
jgi:hypothetical protein